MDHRVRVLTEDDVDAALAIRAQAFASRMSDTDRAKLAAHIARGVTLGVDLRGELAGLLAIRAMGQFFGGHSVPMGGVASVAVKVEHRSMGVASALLNAAIERMHVDGQVLSTLHPATTRFYRRAGWELGGGFPVRTVATRALTTLPRGEPARLRSGTSADYPALAACYRRVAPARTGWLDRPDWYWPHEYVRGEPGTAGEHLVVFDGSDGGVDGFARYRLHGGGLSPGYTIEVSELAAIDAAAEVTLWRAIGSFAMQADTVAIIGGSADRLVLLLDEQDVAERQAADWMTRLVDAPGAIAARGYPSAVSAAVHLELRDGLAPWNDGRWVFEVSDGEGTLSRGGTGAVRLGVHGLSGLYTGHLSADDLEGIGALVGAAEDYAALDAIFAGPRPAMIDYF